MSGGGAHGSTFRERADEVRKRVDLVALVGRTVKLGRGKRPRGKCPFHGSKSDSLSVNGPQGFAHCFGCGWSGDAIRFVAEIEGITPLAALEQLEADAGITVTPGDATVTRARNPVVRRAREDARAEVARVESVAMGRHIWATAGAIQGSRALRYLESRGVPRAMLSGRTADLRFNAQAPVSAWAIDRAPDSMPHAPALVALMRRGAPPFDPVGVHVTWLNPDGTDKMVRKRGDGSLYPARKMLGPAGGACVVLGDVAQLGGTAPLYVGEGLETVLSGMALCDAPPQAIGLAVLSLDNLQGGLLLWKKGVWPLFDLRGDPERPPVCFAHEGPVTGLVDADMSPLRGARDRRTGDWLGFPVVERRGGPITDRAITGAERAGICAQLFAQGWRRAGCARVVVLRPAMGMDFNDMMRAA